MGTALVKIPQMANQNLTLDNHGKPKVKASSPVARVAPPGFTEKDMTPTQRGKYAAGKNWGEMTPGQHKKEQALLEHLETQLPKKRKHSIFGKAMTDVQLQRRKRASATTAIVTSTLGLGALAAHGGGAAARQIGSGRRLLHIPGTGYKNRKLMQTGRQVQRAAIPVSLTSGGISGAAGYNYAGIQREEARRNQVKKAFDSERNRFRRNRVGEPVAFAAGGAALGGAGYLGHRAATKETADVRTGRANLGRAKAAASKTEAGFSAAQVARESSEVDVKRTKHTLTQMEKPPDPKKTYTPEQTQRRLDNLKAQQKLVATHEKAHFDAGANEKKLKDLIPKKHARVGVAAQGVKTLQRVRRITGTKAGALAALGAGGVAGGVYLHRVPNSRSGQSYSKRYRPGQS